MKYFIKVFVVSFLIFTMTISGGLFFVTSKISGIQDEIGGAAEAENDSVELDEKDKGVVNVLLMGVDSLDAKKSNTRTDTMMLLSFDPKTSKASVVSIPRDTRVKIRGRSGYDKINAANVYGGVDLAVKTVKDLLGVPVHHYVKVDYQALFKTVDDIGGVEVDVPIRMKYNDPYASPPLHIDLQKGKQVLDGSKAMQFLRFRKGSKGYPGYPDQDLGRIKAQQSFLDATIRKLLTPSSILKIPDYVQTLFMYVETDMRIKDMLDMAYMAKEINPDEMTKTTLPGTATMINGISYYQVKQADIDAIKEEIFSSAK